MKRLARFLLSAVLVAPLLVWVSAPSATAAVGDADTSITFNGTNTTFQIADTPSLDISNAITMQAWVKPTGTGSSSYHMVMNKESAYELWITEGYWNYALNGTGGWYGVNTGVAAINDQWQHVAAVRAANTNAVQFYYNGKLVFTGSADGVGTGNITNTNLPFQVGSRSSSVGTGFSTYFKGEIDELRLYNVARTAAEIATDMSSYGPFNTTGLVLYYDFNDYSTSLANRSTSASAGPATLTAYGTVATSAIETTVITGNRKVIKFPRTYLSANGWKVPLGVRNLWALVIAGGGGGGSDEGGGGGAGGFVENTNFAVTPLAAISVVVGGGGAGALDAADATALAGNSGTNSNFGSISAVGGGGGGSGLNTNNLATRNGQSGGSGGGGGGEAGYTAGSAGIGTDGQGFSGGAGRPGATARGGGGGGAGEVGNTDGNSAGGDGLTSTIEDGATAIYYAGGGSGGGGNTVAGAVVGGLGGGGSGGGSATTPTDATPNTGGGGGGGSNSGYRNYAGYAGASGIIILVFTAFSGEAAAISEAKFRTTKQIVITILSAGKATFLANNKRIPGCIKVPTVSSSSITATCNWKPSFRGPVKVSAIFTPNSSPSVTSTIDVGSVTVGKRTGTR